MRKEDIARELLKIAKTIVSSRLEAPPKMVDDIYKWAKRQGSILSKQPDKVIRKKFRVDLDGWKYKPVYDAAPYKKKAKSRYGIFEVELGATPQEGKDLHFWDKGNGIMWITYVDTGLKKEIEHEVRHWAQSFMSIALGRKFGLPSKEMRNPEITQHGLDYQKSQEFKKTRNFDDMSQWLNDKRRELSELGIDDYHTLDDVEFYTIMEEIINTYTPTMDYLSKGNADRKTRNSVLKVMINSDGRLNDLKVFSRAKWRKMVNEILKAF